MIQQQPLQRLNPVKHKLKLSLCSLVYFTSFSVSSHMGKLNFSENWVFPGTEGSAEEEKASCLRAEKEILSSTRLLRLQKKEKKIQLVSIEIPN